MLGLAGLLFFVIIGPAAARTIPRITATLDKDRVAVGDTILLTISAAWAGEASEFVFLPPQPPEFRGLEMTGSAQKSVVYRTDGKLHQVWEYLFTLKGEDKGTARVGVVRILYHRHGEEEVHSLTTEPLEVTIFSGGVAFFSSIGSALLTIGVVMVAVIIIVVYVRWTIRRYKNKSNEVIADYVKNLEAESLKELDHLRKLKVQGNIDGYLEGIWKILADYLEKKYTITISPESFREVLEGERASALSEEAAAELARILKVLEESRFGSYRAENRGPDDILKRVYSFIESQQSQTKGERNYEH